MDFDAIFVTIYIQTINHRLFSLSKLDLCDVSLNVLHVGFLVSIGICVDFTPRT